MLHVMDKPSSHVADRDILMLMNEPTSEKEHGANFPPQASYDPQQFVLQGNMDMESFDDLLTDQGISIENGEISVVEQNGQQYILLPSVSVAQVLQPGDVVASSSPALLSTGTCSPGEKVLSDGLTDLRTSTELTKRKSDNTSICESIEMPAAEENIHSLQSSVLAQKTATTTSNDVMDIHRIVPSLCPNPAISTLIRCPVCEFTAADELTLDRHMEQHRRSLGERIYKGSKENSLKRSPRKSKRRRKKRNTCKFIRSEPQIDAKKHPFLCSVCGEQILMVSEYKRHMKEHQSEKEFKCEICSETFNVEANLSLHRAIHSKPGESGYICPACQRTFMRLASLKAHLPVHLVDENMICTECGDEFALKSDLDCHLQQHRMDLQLQLKRRGERESRLSDDDSESPSAEESDRTFKYELKGHQKKRAEPQQCMFCDKLFHKESLFKRHVLIHTGEKPFSCFICKRSFNQAGALKMHLMTHSGSKPYSCPHCPQVYTQRGNLRLHMARAHSNSNRHSCYHCSCGFKTLGSLNAHITKFHKKSTQESICDSTSCSVEPRADIVQQALDDCGVDPPRREEAPPDPIQPAALSDKAPVQLLHSSQTLYQADPVQSLSFTEALNDDDRTLRNSNGVAAQVLQGDVQPSQALSVRAYSMDGFASHNLDYPDNPLCHNSCKVNSIGNIDNPIHENASNDDILYSKNNNAGADGRGCSISPSTDTRGEMSSPQQRRGGKSSRVSGVYMRSSGQAWRVRRVDGVRWHQCMHCTKEFKKPSDLVRHIRTHTRERPYTCGVCLKSFAVKTSLTSHENIHLGYKPYTCQVCSKSFSTSGSLKIHIRLHTGARPFKCQHCDLSFRTTGHRQNHVLSHVRGTAHKKVRKSSKDMTNLILPTSLPVTLESSIRISEDGKLPPPLEDQATRTQVCVLCNKSFKKWCHLKQHMRCHTGERPYTCLQCSRNFASSSTLKAHMRVHTGHKPYSCVDCSRTFSSRNALNRHMTIHSLSRPFMCPYCKKSFKTNGTCKKHIETHRHEVSKMMHEQTLASDATESTCLESSLLESLDLVQPELNSAESNSVPTSASDTVQTPNCFAPHNALADFNEDAMNLGSNPTLVQIDPNIIQDISGICQIRDFNEHDDFIEDLAALKQPTSIAKDKGQEDCLHAELQIEDHLNFKCMGCSKIFESRNHLDRHEGLVRASSLALRCSLCCHSVACQKSLISHVKAHNAANVYYCPICFVSFADSDGLDAHKQVHEKSGQNAVLKQSGKESDVFSSVPMTSVTKDTKRRRGGFYQLSEEQSQILEKTDPNQIMTLSERILLSAVAEKNKVSLVQKPGTRGRFKEYDSNGPVHRNVCQFCPKSFQKPSDLARHVRTHTGDKPFKCATCGKSFAIKSTLKSHEQGHLKKKMFRCHICDVMYAAKASLKVHMRLHTGTKPYKCPHCPETFRTSGHRKNHMAAHFVYPHKTSNLPSSSTGLPAMAASPHGRATDVDSRAKANSQTNPDPSASSFHAPPAAPKTDLQNISSITVKGSTPPNPDADRAPTKEQTVVWPDMTLTLPADTFDILQESSTLHLPMQLAGQGNFTLQIDPLLIHSSMPDPSAVSVSSTSDVCSWPPSNVVLQPVNQLCLQPIAHPPSESPLARPTHQDQQHVTDQSEENPQRNSDSTLMQAVQQLLGNLQNPCSQPGVDGQGLAFTLDSEEV